MNNEEALQIIEKLTAAVGYQEARKNKCAERFIEVKRERDEAREIAKLFRDDTFRANSMNSKELQELENRYPWLVEA